MKDLITYVKDLEAMYLEAVTMIEVQVVDDFGNMIDHHLASFFTVDHDDQTVSFNVTKVPVYYAASGETLCLIRGVSREVLDSCESIKILGECVNQHYEFDSEESKILYETVYDIKEKIYTDEEGNEITYLPPYMIGVFA